MTDIFVSYAREDRERVRPLVDVLEARGWSVFWDFHIPPGETWDTWIGSHLASAAVVIVAWTDDSIKSDYVREEAELGRDRLIPVLFDDVRPPFGFGRIHSADLTTWDGSPDAVVVVELLPHVSRKLGQSPEVVAPEPVTPPRPIPLPETQVSDKPTFRDRLQDGSLGPLMVLIPAGNFLMGSPESEAERDEVKGPAHPVTVQAFAVGCYPVTFEEYDLFVEATGRDSPRDKGWGRGNRPVINVSWDDALAYAEWLSAQTAKPYRLLTEAEWEYAARAGTTSRYWWGDDIREGGKSWANCDGSGSEWSDKQTSPVGSFPANPFGLHDTAGNVFEWVEDCWHENYEGAPGDGSAWLEAGGGDCGRRVLRGGSWLDLPSGLRSAYRYGYDRDSGTIYFIGLRLAQDSS